MQKNRNWVVKEMKNAPEPLIGYWNKTNKIVVTRDENNNWLAAEFNGKTLALLNENYEKVNGFNGEITSVARAFDLVDSNQSSK